MSELSKFFSGGKSVTKGILKFLLCASVVFKYAFSSTENESGDTFFKTVIKVSSILQAYFETLCVLN